MSAKKAYEEIFSNDPAHTLVLHELFPTDVEVGARKQRHSTAARA
jgi:hypothetical protein